MSLAEKAISAMNALVDRFRCLYGLLFSGSVVLQSAFLLLRRLYFFWQLFLIGKDKLLNSDDHVQRSLIE